MPETSEPLYDFEPPKPCECFVCRQRRDRELIRKAIRAQRIRRPMRCEREWFPYTPPELAPEGQAP
jgi:hypothetical protein